MSRWFILRTGGGQTLPLARSLQAAGFDAWTPARTARRVLFRGTRSERRMDIDVAILPTFVFARERDLGALTAAAARPISPHPAFSIFHHDGRVPLIRDAALVGLREEEDRATATARAIREAETHADAERIRIAAMKSESARRRATKEMERQELAALRSTRRAFATGAEVEVAEMPALAGVVGVVEESNGSSARVRFGTQSWKIDGWRLSPSELHHRAA